MSRDRLQTQDLFLHGTNSKCAEKLKTPAHDYSVLSDSRNNLIHRRSTTFVSGTSESWILFY